MRWLARQLSLTVLLLLGACADPPLYQAQSYVFGTLVDISIYGAPEAQARAAADAVLKDFQTLHQRLHAWQPDSELSQLNRALARGETAPVAADLADMLNDASQLSARAGGLFNPAIGGLIRQWGFQRDEYTPVDIDPVRVEALVAAAPRMSDLHIESGSIRSDNPAVQLDLGGYAKGLALDRALRQLRQAGIQHALVNIGGNVIALGQHGERPWNVGIQHPRQPGAMATVALQDGWAIGTSGDYQRYFELDGQRYCHLIDPRSGYPAQHTQAVTVLIPPGPQAGTLSDVASKPIFIAAQQQRAQVAQAMQVQHVLVVDEHGQRFLSRAMADRLNWLDKHAKTQLLF
ncbi:FAD:protein FMN transferase [Pseudomethylobacillus aquaticus]|uniref:FAD:protein FMN transferase n=1 Tax=Pseudomethylobacillus aquaticus TaxID=2676064 RepID=A0A3N0V2H3_9PROT|nr:FAD:protein FMN transferase [Pseudomethylobacillus aquaticus]ROH86980.1 FAD:protein FMN transferase [Pseudomethylobacillus aquaticus]